MLRAVCVLVLSMTAHWAAMGCGAAGGAAGIGASVASAARGVAGATAGGAAAPSVGAAATDAGGGAGSGSATDTVVAVTLESSCGPKEVGCKGRKINLYAIKSNTLMRQTLAQFKVAGLPPETWSVTALLEPGDTLMC